MKLVEILARELEKWPTACQAITQDDDGDLNNCPDGNPSFKENIGCWMRGNGLSIFLRCELSDDYATAIVTREMWQAERGRIAKPGNKANVDGWVRHRGGKCPVGDGVIVEVRLRDGTEWTGRDADVGEFWHWRHGGGSGDIMAYRIIKPAERPAPEIKVTHIDGEAGVIHAESVSSSCGPVKAEWCEIQDSGPLQWRDRIREIDRTAEALEEERVSLIQRLEGEGFKLIDQVNAKIAEVAQAHDDMSDWRNWKRGDTVIVVGENDARLEIGSTHVVRSVEDADYKGSMPVSIWTSDDFTWPSTLDDGDICCFKFHSRPSA